MQHAELQWLLDRGLTMKTIVEAGIENGVPNYITIPYRKDGKEVGRQFRSIATKEFKFSLGFEPCLYLPLGYVPTTYHCYLAEGVMDTLILHQLGYPAVGIPSASLYSCARELPHSKIYLALDNDDAGNQACIDVANLGLPAKLSRVKYDGKDPNDNFLKYGEFRHTTVPYILGGIKRFNEIARDGDREHNHIVSFNGAIPDWSSGDLVVLYGDKGSGKTSWLLQMLSTFAAQVPKLFEEYELLPEKLIEWYSRVGGGENDPCYMTTEYMDSTPNQLLGRIISAVRNLDVRLVVIDTLHYLTSGKDQVVNAITTLTQKLKLLAMQYKVVVVIVMHETNGSTRDCHVIGSADHILHLVRLQNAISIEGKFRFYPARDYVFDVVFGGPHGKN